MDRISATPQNAALAAIARRLAQAKELGNRAQIPFIEMGLGDLLLGAAPQEVEEWSYGNAPMRVVGGGTGSLIPQMKPGRAEGVMDAAFLGADIAGLGGLGKMGARRAMQAVTPRAAGPLSMASAGPEMGRRGFLNAVGGLGAAAAVGAVPKAVREIATEAAAPAVRTMAEEAAPVVARQAAGAAPVAARRFMEDLLIDTLGKNARFLTEDLAEVADDVPSILFAAREEGAEGLLDLGFSPEQADRLVSIVDELDPYVQAERLGVDVDEVPDVLDMFITTVQAGGAPEGVSDEFVQRMMGELGDRYRFGME